MVSVNVNLPLKAVTDRMQSCRAVKWAIATFGTVLVARLGETFATLLADGQSMPFDTQLALFDRKLTLDCDRLVTTDRAYRDQKALEAVVRGHRDAQLGEVNSGVVGLRQAFAGIYSEDKLAEIGFARQTPQLPAALQEQASHLVTRLNDSQLDLTGSRFGDYQLDAPRLAQSLVASVESYDQVADELAKEARRTEALKLAKDEALAEYNSSFLWIARTVESLCRLAGLDEVAGRVRPSRRRKGVTALPFEPPADAGAEDDNSSGDGSSEPTTDA